MPENPEFRDMCQDILLSRSNLPLSESTQVLWEVFNHLIAIHAMQLEVVEAAPQVRVIPAVEAVEPIEEADMLSQWLAAEQTESDTSTLEAPVSESELLSVPPVQPVLAEPV